MFWMKPEDVILELQASGLDAVRILICGKAGVGKSTIINSVFGFDLVRCSIPACKLLMTYYFRHLLKNANMANMTLKLHLGTQINPES